jgi:hypothetical protein
VQTILFISHAYLHLFFSLVVGSQYLNQRIHTFVNKYNAQYDGHGPIIQIFNDHDVESRDYTANMDGRHYHYLNMLRIRLLMNQIQCVKTELGSKW